MEKHTDHTPDTTMKRLPSSCTVCGVEATEAIRLVERNGTMYCESHALKEDLDHVELEELGRHIGLLLKDRYQYHSATLLENLELLAGLDGDVILGLMEGKTFAQVDQERAADTLAGPSGNDSTKERPRGPGRHTAS